MPDALPLQLRRFGYRTGYFTTGDLSFTRKDAWLRSIGFEELDGHDDPAYDGLDRHMFSAAPDGALYDRALAAIRDGSETRDSTLFMVLETVSTHPPFVDPVSGAVSEEAAFRYADAQLGRFADSLAADGFLRHGLLIVMGDHRAMMPVSRGEEEWAGRSTVARVPLVLLGAGVPTRRVDDMYSQHDVLPTLVGLVSGSLCLRADQGDLLDASGAAPRWTMHVRGDEPDVVDVYHDGGFSAVRLDGDDTRVVGGTASGAQKFVDAINAARIRALRRAQPGG